MESLQTFFVRCVSDEFAEERRTIVALFWGSTS
jgi:hypothetical protein